MGAKRAKSWRERRSAIAAALALGALLLTAGPALADDYEPRRAGHPLRIVAYALHPVGVALDYLIFRPAHWLGHREPIRTIFGHTGDHRYPYARRHPHSHGYSPDQGPHPYEKH